MTLDAVHSRHAGALVDRGAAIGLACFFVAVIAARTMAGWNPIYPLDDSYIHLALARTMATAGIWGSDPTIPAAASSSPLWTLLLAAFYRAWPASALPDLLWVPFGLNVTLGAALVLLWRRILGPGTWAAAAIVLLILAVPLAPIALLGMEHGLHILLATLLGWFAVTRLDAPRTTPRDALLIAVLAAAAVAARYESLFLVAALLPFALWRRHWNVAIALSAGAGATLVGFGLWWIAQGGWFLPNPLLLKRSLFLGQVELDLLTRLLLPLLTLLRNLELPVLRELLLLLLCLIPALLGATWRQGYRSENAFAAVAWMTTLLHLGFAGTGWLHRYEAWIVALDLLAVAWLLVAGPAAASGRALRIGLAILAALGVARGAIATADTVRSVDDRRLEHLAPAEFIAQAFPGETILVNDLGAMAYFVPGKVIDLFGLGHNEPIRLRRAPPGFTRDTLAGWARREGATIAVLQVCWHEVFPRIPDTWQFVATWTVPRNIAFGDHTVGFFAIDPLAEPRLRAALQRFPRPPEVIQTMGPTPGFSAFLQARNRLETREQFHCPPID